MVRNIKMNWRTRLWIRRHNRKHTTPERQGVVIRKHQRFVPLADMQEPVVVAVVQGTAHCVCGGSRPAYMQRVYVIDPATAS